ncbi:MAG: hypothetical protein HYS09_03260 [Chloroflexi bacterium]|nr:hypothetical protein [Chloroflexota bacterium]
MNRFLIPAAVLVIAGLTLGPVPPAYACSCAASTAAELVAGADIVATGKVVRLLDEERGGVDAIVVVQRYLKGDGPVEITVDDPVGEADCGFLERDSLGEPYLLFLQAGVGRYRTNICDGSTHLAGEEGDQRFLDEVVAVTGLGTPTGDGDVPWPSIVLGSALGGIALALASAILLRRRIMGQD